MAKQELNYCRNCEKDTMQSWCYDNDSEPDNPQFFLCCLECGCDNDLDQKPGRRT